MSYNKIKTEAEIAAMREGGHMLATVLNTLKERTKPGLTPQDMSRLAADTLKSLGGEPAFKGFHGYPDIICISVNDQVQHSIPTSRPFAEGDVINYDFGVRVRGMITDGGITVGVGKLSEDKQRLIKGTAAALDAALNVARAGCRTGDISATIEKVLKAHKLGIVRELVGHGVGHSLHEEPNIPNYGRAGTGSVLEAGMTVAIEPIATLGSELITTDDDGWTLWTIDGSPAAQFEHSVLITDDGCEVFTQV